MIRLTSAFFSDLLLCVIAYDVICFNYMSRNCSGQSIPLFHIGDVPIFHNTALSPMDGFCDHPFRMLIRALGSAMTISEFINGIDIERGHRFLKNRIAFNDAERPFGYQLLDNDVDRLVNGALFLESFKPDFFDLNFGCPSKQVTHRGAGSALLLEPKLIEHMIKEMVKRTCVPVTAKIRLGWDDSTLNYLEISKILEDNGCSMISVHARTKTQAYKGSADWSAITDIKKHVKIPVLGNGDVRSVSDIQKMLSVTGCDGVLIGRRAVQNPWIFKGIEFSDVPITEVCDFYSTLFTNIIGFYENPVAPKIFRKYIVGLLSNYPTVSRSERIELLRSNCVEKVFQLLDKIIQQQHACIVAERRT